MWVAPDVRIPLSVADAVRHDDLFTEVLGFIMSITFQSQVFTIKTTKDPIGGDRKNRTILGSTDPSENLIIIDGTLPQSRQEEVLIHELIHISDMSLSEFAVNDLGQALYSLMFENRLLGPGWFDRLVDGDATILEAEMVNELSQDIKESQEAVGIFRMVVDEGPAPPGNGFAVSPTQKGDEYLLDVVHGGKVNRVACRRAEATVISGHVPYSKAMTRELVELIEVVLKEEPHPALTRLAKG